MTSEHRMLIDCYLSGQITEADWHQRLSESAALRAAWDAFDAERRGQ